MTINGAFVVLLRMKLMGGLALLTPSSMDGCRWSIEMDELLIGGRRQFAMCQSCMRLKQPQRAKQFPTDSNVGTPYKETEYSTCKVGVVQPDGATPDRPSRHIKVERFSAILLRLSLSVASPCLTTAGIRNHRATMVTDRRVR